MTNKYLCYFTYYLRIFTTDFKLNRYVLIMNIFNSAKARLRVISFAEGLSYILLLFIAVPLKYFGGHPEAVKILGPIHGALFVLYVLIIILVNGDYKWSAKTTFLALLASILPAGTFYADYKLFRELPDKVE